MFNIGTGELLVIGLLALIVLGPDKLPQAARQVGKITSQARQIANGFKQEMNTAMRDATSTEEASGPRLDAPPATAEPIDAAGVDAKPLEGPGPASPASPKTNGSTTPTPPEAVADERAES